MFGILEDAVAKQERQLVLLPVDAVLCGVEPVRQAESYGISVGMTSKSTGFPYMIGPTRKRI